MAAVLAIGLTTPAQAAPSAPPACNTVHGTLSETVIDPFGSPGDPLGRTVLQSTGTINAIGTSILTSVGPGPTPGTLGATTRHVFVVRKSGQLSALGMAVFTPIPGSADVNEVLTLTVTGGTGKFAAATGTITATGVGSDFFPLPPGPSSANGSTFELESSGQICGVAP